MTADDLAATIATRGFAVIDGHLDRPALERVRGWHARSIAEADSADVSRSSSGSNTRAHLVRHCVELDALYLDPRLLAVATRCLPEPIRLSSFLSRTVHPGAAAQPLHVDAPRLIGFIYALDDFHPEHGATRFGETAVTAPAGSLLIYDGSRPHGFSGHRGTADRRSIQGAFIPRTQPSSPVRERIGRTDLARYLLGDPAHAIAPRPLDPVQAAIAASWDERTTYQRASRDGNPALGQCYPTARVVQWFVPELEVAVGEVWTGATTEAHFWNVRPDGERVDLTWQQFPAGSTITTSKLLDRVTSDSAGTVERCELLKQRALLRLCA